MHIFLHAWAAFYGDVLLTEAQNIVEKRAYFTVLNIKDGDLTVITITGTHYASQQDILAEVTGSDVFP